MKDINIVLVNPEIPQNTGNVSRTCAVTGAALHIIRPTGFEINDRNLKRAGLDYWDKLDVSYYDSLDELYNKYPSGQFYYFSAKGERSYAEAEYKRGVFLVFGKESVGLDGEIIEKNRDKTLRIPMLPALRCLNLSNSVAVAVYKVLSDMGFPGMV